MTVNTFSKLLPYALMAFVGIAGWSMRSTALLTVVVIGTACVAIGTSMATRPESGTKSPGFIDPGLGASPRERQ